HPDPHSFPTRRSSDLGEKVTPDFTVKPHHVQARGSLREAQRGDFRSRTKNIVAQVKPIAPLSRVLGIWEKLTPYTTTRAPWFQRSEEHTSELQSLRHL